MRHVCESMPMIGIILDDINNSCEKEYIVCDQAFLQNILKYCDFITTSMKNFNLNIMRR